MILKLIILFILEHHIAKHTLKQDTIILTEKSALKNIEKNKKRGKKRENLRRILHNIKNIGAQRGAIHLKFATLRCLFSYR